MTISRPTIYTIGHSTLSYARYVSVLRSVFITAVVDVRSQPRSRRFPDFNIGTLKPALRKDHIAYVFLGRELGGRPANESLYSDGIADYEKMAATPEFNSGLERVLRGANDHRIALMCSEHHPLECHRCLMVGRELAKRNVQVSHILSEGNCVDQSELERELLEKYGFHTDFLPREERLVAAYRKRALQVAYTVRKRKVKNTINEESSDSACCNDRLYEEDSARLL